MRKIIIIFFVFVIKIVFAQDSDLYDIQISDSLLKVPTLNEAINQALKKSPLLKSADIETTIKEFQLKSVRKEWMGNLGIESFYKYGSIDNINIQNIDDINQVTNAKTTGNRYSVGFYIKMPFLSFLTQKNKNNIAKRELEKSMYEKQMVQNEIKKIVIQQFNKYQLNKQLIAVKNRAYIASQMQVEKANRDYKNGNLTIYELAKVTEASTKAETDYITAKINFRISYLLLMELIGEPMFNSNSSE